MIAAEIVVTLVETPGDGQAGDGSTRRGDRPMRRQNRRADAVAVEPGRRVPVERQQSRLPFAPFLDIGPGGGIEALLQAGKGDLRRLLRRRAKAQRQQDLRVLGRNSRSPRSALHCRPLPFGKPDRAGQRYAIAASRRRSRHSQRSTCPRAGRKREPGRHRAPSEQDSLSLVVADPGGIAHAGVDEMRRQQRIDAVVKSPAFQRREGDFLQQSGRFGSVMIRFSIR